MHEGLAVAVSARVREILETVDEKIAKDYGNDLPPEGSRLLAVHFSAEDETDVEAMRLLDARGLARWLDGPGLGQAFAVEAETSLRATVNAGQAKATLALAARIDALEGAIEQLVGQNERLLAAVTKPKALPAAKKAKKAAKKKGAHRG